MEFHIEKLKMQSNPVLNKKSSKYLFRFFFFYAVPASNFGFINAMFNVGFHV